MRGLLTRTIAGIATLAAASIATPAAAQDEAGFQAYLPTLRAQALAAGVQRATVESVFPTLTFNQRVVDLDRQQPGGNPNAPVAMFAPYRIQHVDAARISRGRAAYVANRSKLTRVEAETGVPESIMVAIWGHETNYGSYTGNFDLLRSLATLAYEGRRRDLFAGEFVAALKMIDRGVPRADLKGSWAGATGNPQFLPAGARRRRRWPRRYLEQRGGYAGVDRQLFRQRRLAPRPAMGDRGQRSRRLRSQRAGQPARFAALPARVRAA